MGYLGPPPARRSAQAAGAGFADPGLTIVLISRIGMPTGEASSMSGQCGPPVRIKAQPYQLPLWALLPRPDRRPYRGLPRSARHLPFTRNAPGLPKPSSASIIIPYRTSGRTPSVGRWRGFDRVKPTISAN